MGAQQLQGEVLPSDQIASHSIGEIRPLELIAANPVDHFLAVSGRAVYNAEWDVQAMKYLIPVIIHQQPPAPDIYRFSAAKTDDLLLHALYHILSGRLYHLPVFLPELQGVQFSDAGLCQIPFSPFSS